MPEESVPPTPQRTRQTPCDESPLLSSMERFPQQAQGADESAAIVGAFRYFGGEVMPKLLQLTHMISSTGKDPSGDPTGAAAAMAAFALPPSTSRLSSHSSPRGVSRAELRSLEGRVRTLSYLVAGMSAATAAALGLAAFAALRRR
jgi:hypothetical protein